MRNAVSETQTTAREWRNRWLKLERGQKWSENHLRRPYPARYRLHRSKNGSALVAIDKQIGMKPNACTKWGSNVGTEFWARTIQLVRCQRTSVASRVRVGRIWSNRWARMAMLRRMQQPRITGINEVEGLAKGSVKLGCKEAPPVNV